jgi:hypothetical protein
MSNDDDPRKWVIESVVKGLIEALFKLVSGSERKERLKQDCKDYLYGLADNLDQIVASLEKDKIPDGMGTQIKTSLEGFEGKIKKLKIASEKKEKILALQKRINNSLRAGQFVDDYIAGRILHIKPAERNEKLVEMKRTVGSIRGYADAL